MRFIGSLLLLGALLTGAYAQRPRTMEADTSAKTTAPAPTTVKAKYEGGVFGYTKTMEGTLTLDDANEQLLFREKNGDKQINIPYSALTSAFADTQKKQPKAATIAGSVPTIFTMPAQFIKTKVRYLTLQYNDPDSQQSGITSFKLQNLEVVHSVLAALAEKSGMVKRGDIYVKKNELTKLAQ